MEPLFIEAELVFETKTAAAEIALPEDPNAWGGEILQELYKQVPYIADFDPEPVMTQVDGQRAFGFGYVLVSNKTELPPEASPQTLEAAGVKRVRLPIIVKDGKLLPFDLLITEDGKMLPLTETRLREALFRPQTFDMTSRTPGDTSLISQLYPPIRQNFGGAAGMSASGEMGKAGAKMASPLEAVLATVTPHDYDAFLQVLSDETMQAAYTKNAHAVAGAFAIFAHAKPIDLEKHASVFAHVLPPSVAQITKDVGGYILKTASHYMWAPIMQHLDRGELVTRFGDKIALAADLNGGVTLANDAVEAEEPEQGPPPELIADFGVYRVQDETGRDLVGYVFPNLIDLDGTKLPMALFTNGSQSAVQGEIVGVRVGDAVPVQEGRPKGNGVFCTMEEGEVEATLPITVHNSFTNMHEGTEVSLMAETMDGRAVTIQQQPNIQKLTIVDDMLLVPAHYRWLSLEGSEAVVLASAPEDVGKTAHAITMVDTVVIRGEGNSFSLDGTPVEKIAAEERHFVDADGALFLLAGLGVDLAHAQHKIAVASSGRAPVEVRTGREIQTASDQIHGAFKTASERLEGVPDLRVVLFKEAAVIPDPVAVDTVLSLGFINPENIASLIRSMPKIEEGQRRMCELLLAARLGIKEIPVYAIERAMHATEEVLEGLKVLAFQKN
jgi:hypothetical protein